jgi:hypothetical protein
MMKICNISIPLLSRRGQGWSDRLRRLIIGAAFFTIVLSPLKVHAQSYIIGSGPSRLLDTYLTPEHFSGTGFTFLYIKELKKPESRWSTMMEHEVDFSSTKDRSKSITMLEGNYNFYWGKYYKWNLFDEKLQLQAGGLANANLGFLYNLVTSNNPAQLRASLNIMPSGIGTYNFRLWRQQFSVRYEVALPLIGLMFSPNYGQSYYEIFSRGNYDHNIVPTTFVSAPTMRQMLTLEWRTSTKWHLCVGYLGNYQQAQVNNLKQHVYTHRVLIGMTRGL